MRKSFSAGQNRPVGQPSHWGAVAISVCLLVVLIVVDYLTGEDVSFTLLYLVPISTAVWFVGRKVGLSFCVLSAAASLAMELTQEPLLAKAFWNTGIRLGVYLTFAALLSYAREHSVGSALVFKVHRQVLIGLGLAGVLALGAGIVQRQMPASAVSVRPSFVRHVSAKSNSPLAELADLLDGSMRLSRPVLLGSRDPTGPSCVSVCRTGDVVDAAPPVNADLNGGPGSTLAVMYAIDRKNCNSPMLDFVWHQKRLKTYLENVAATNRPAGELAHELSEKTREFWELANTWTDMPSSVVPVGFTRNTDWPGYCLTELDQAVGARDLDGVKHWSGELAAAAFSLDDLHRWLGFLVENHLAALEFQRRCESLFATAEEQHRPYSFDMTISQYPAGVLGLNGISNYYEVERQAERLFSMPPDRLTEIATDAHLNAASLWVPPGVRECFLKLQAVLSPENQAVWAEAARTPYHHSYLVNMLFRAGIADTDDELCTVLKKFDALNPHTTVGPFLSVLMYRGHSFAGLEWGDRYQPELVQAADEIKPDETDLQALMNACRWTNHFYRSPATYSPTLTLRGALEQKKLDCVRSTDMIGAIFRNAGRTRFGHVRWCSETGAHSVAAYLGVENERLKTQIVDGLMPPDQPEVWPDCYFHGHAWPTGLENNAQPYAAELYVRGLDSYIWAEGYIIRGPNAGWMTTAGIPYSVHRKDSSTRKVFDGPYPQ